MIDIGRLRYRKKKRTIPTEAVACQDHKTALRGECLKMTHTLGVQITLPHYECKLRCHIMSANYAATL